jgi:hypothetical protein
MLEKVITKHSRVYCECCNSDSIECYTIYNKPVNYNILLSRYTKEEILEKLNTAPLDYMKCNKCGRKYSIDWSDGLPSPLRASYMINNVYINRK